MLVNLMPTGDDLKDEKVALIALCKALSRKGNDNAILYIYQECKVKCLSQHLGCCLITLIPGLPHFVQYNTRKWWSPGNTYHVTLYMSGHGVDAGVAVPDYKFMHKKCRVSAPHPTQFVMMLRARSTLWRLPQLSQRTAASLNLYYG